MLSSSLRAGLSLVQAIESLVENSVPPLSQEFDLLLREYRIGIPSQRGHGEPGPPCGK